MKQQILLTKLNNDAVIPSYARAWDAGADLSSVEDVVIPAGGFVMVGTGLAMEIPAEYVGLIHPRSGMAAKYGITVLNAPGTIDAGYRGEIKVVLINHSKTDYKVNKGDKIAQLVVQQVYDVKFVETDQLSESARMSGGFGSSGV